MYGPVSFPQWAIYHRYWYTLFSLILGLSIYFSTVDLQSIYGIYTSKTRVHFNFTPNTYQPRTWGIQSRVFTTIVTINKVGALGRRACRFCRFKFYLVYLAEIMTSCRVSLFPMRSGEESKARGSTSTFTIPTSQGPRNKVLRGPICRANLFLHSTFDAPRTHAHARMGIVEFQGFGQDWRWDGYSQKYSKFYNGALSYFGAQSLLCISYGTAALLSGTTAVWFADS